MKLYRVVLPVRGIDRAATIYARLLQIPGERVSPGRHYFDCGGTMLACYDPEADGDGEQGGWRHHPNQSVYFAVGDLEGAYQRAQEAGCRIVGDGIQRMPWGERMFWAFDPFDNPISFVDETTVFTGFHPPEDTVLDAQAVETLSPNVQAAEMSLPSTDLAADLAFYTGDLGFRLDTIFPADNPSVAVLSGHGLRLRLQRGSDAAPGVLRLLCREPATLASGKRELTAPNGVRIHIVEANPPLETPPTQHAFVVRRLKDNSPWVIGRAGMRYRDLIPGRLGGSIIASHIRIPDAGPVPDMVHYHTVGFQLIFCIHGWVRLVYEDQGPPFILKAGDCVIQPPRIRHRVLESSENLQVIEIGVPAEHITTVDHEMTLPTAVLNPDRTFGGQTFCRSEVDKAVWTPWRLRGFEARETGINSATAGVASVRVARPVGPTDGQVTSHTSDILFTFVMSGSVTLRGEGQGAHTLSEGDAYVIPPHMKTSIADCSDDLQLMEVSLPARFETNVHGEGLEA